MLSQIILKILLEKSLSGGKFLLDVYLNNFDEIVDKTITNFEKKYFGLSGTNLKEFLNSQEFKSQLLLHGNYRELDYDYLGGVLSTYINVAGEVTAKEVLLEFFIELENNINKQPKLRDQLILVYHRSHDQKLGNIERSMDDLRNNTNKMIELFEDISSKKAQRIEIDACLRKYNITDSQLVKLAEKAIKMAESNYINGLSLIVLDRFVDAELQFDKAIEHNPEKATYFLERGNAKSLQKNYADAYKDYSEATRLDSRLESAWVNKGSVLGLLGKNEESLEALEKALELDPNMEEAWNNKGLALNSLGRHEEALKAFDKAIELNSSTPAWINKISAYSKLGKHEEALDASKKGIELNPNMAEAWATKSSTLSDLGKHEEALQASNKALEGTF